MKVTSTRISNQFTVTVPCGNSVTYMDIVLKKLEDMQEVLWTIKNVKTIRELNDLCESGLFRYV